MKKNVGFTLIELMIVVAIIAIIAAIAVPSLLRSRITANETAAIGALRTLTSAQTAFRAGQPVHRYATDLAELVTPPDGNAAPYIDATLGSGTKSGYTFAIQNADATTWECVSAPENAGTSGIRSFFVDVSGIIREGGDSTGTPIE